MHLTGTATAPVRRVLPRQHDITISDLIAVSRQVINHELDTIRDAFDRNGIELVWGATKFLART